jgi:hypothetical protein
MQKTGMIASAVFLFGAGLAMLFAPAEIARAAALPVESRWLISLLAALYLGFAMANWMAKDSAIGGIYQRPLALGNFAHFFIDALSLIRLAASGLLLASVTAVYILFAVFFGWLVFFSSPATKRT